MMRLESSVSDATILSITVELSIMTLEASFALIYDVYSTGIIYEDCQLIINLSEMIFLKFTLIHFYKMS